MLRLNLCLLMTVSLKERWWLFHKPPCAVSDFHGSPPRIGHVIPKRFTFPRYAIGELRSFSFVTGVRFEKPQCRIHCLGARDLMHLLIQRHPQPSFKPYASDLHDFVMVLYGNACVGFFKLIVEEHGLTLFDGLQDDLRLRRLPLALRFLLLFFGGRIGNTEGVEMNNRIFALLLATMEEICDVSALS